MVDQRQQNERSQVTPEIERRCFIQAGLASAGTVLATSVLTSQIVSAAVPPQMTNSGANQIPRRPLAKRANKSRSSALADIISERCNRAIWPYAWFTRRWMRESLFSTTHGNTTTTAAKNGWGLVYREGAIKFS